MQLKDNKVKKLEKIQIAGTVIGHNELTTNPGMLAWRGLTTQREGRFNGFPKFQKHHENLGFIFDWLTLTELSVQLFIIFFFFVKIRVVTSVCQAMKILGFSLHHTKSTIYYSFRHPTSTK